MSLPRALRSFATSLLTALALAGCVYNPGGLQLQPVNYQAADEIVTHLTVLAPDAQPVLIASLVDVNDLDRSSTFGRISAEQIGSRLSQKGFRVLEPRLRGAFAINSSGEFMLSREIRKIATEQSARSVLVGTYATNPRNAFVSVRLISVQSGAVLSSADYTFSLDSDSQQMFKNTGESRDVWPPR